MKLTSMSNKRERAIFFNCNTNANLEFDFCFLKFISGLIIWG